MSLGPITLASPEAQAQATAAPAGAATAPSIPVLPARPGDATAPNVGVTTAAQGGAGTGTTVQPPPARNNDIPDEVIPLVGMTLSIVMAMVILFPIARAIGRWIDRRTDRSLVRVAEVAPQLRQLQESVDAMALELERIGEAQRFQAKLMADRATALPADRAP